MIRIVDPNVIVRFLVNDNGELSKDAFRQLAKGKVFIPSLVLSEIVFILTRAYEIPKKDLISLKDFIQSNFIELEDPKVGLFALELFLENKFSFVDCYLVAKAIKTKGELVTQDKRLKSLYNKMSK